MQKTNEEIALALSRLKATLDRNGVEVDTTVLNDILNKIIFDRIQEQLFQTTTDWDLNSLVRLRNQLVAPAPIPEPEPLKRVTRARKVVQ